MAKSSKQKRRKVRATRKQQREVHKRKIVSSAKSSHAFQTLTPPKSNQHNKYINNQTHTEKQECPKRGGGGVKLNILYNLFSQIAFSVLFATFLAFGLYYLKEKPSLAAWLLFFAWVSIGLAVNFFFQERYNAESETSGVLRPASDPNPLTPHNCSPDSPNDLAVFYGGGVAYSTFNPLTIVEIAGKELLSVERVNGNLLISAEIYDVYGKIIAEIKNNEFTINQNNFFRRERPDKSTLIVYDQYNVEVLNIRYLNPSAIKVLGTFRYKNRPPVVIRENEMEFGGGIISGDCGNDVRTILSLE